MKAIEPTTVYHSPEVIGFGTCRNCGASLTRYKVRWDWPGGCRENMPYYHLRCETCGWTFGRDPERCRCERSLTRESH